MNKVWFNEQLEDIEVPKLEVIAAIHKGIELGKKEKKTTKKQSKIKNISLLSGLAASILIASSFVFSPITDVLANVPIIGSIYENFHSDTGKELASKNLVTELNEKATSNGIDVTLTSAFYDGNVIGITFEAAGNGLSNKLNSDIGPVAGYSLQLFDGTEQKQWAGTREQLKKKGDSYIGAMTLEYPLKQLPTTFNLPLTFTFMGGKEGMWRFNVPVKQIPVEKINSSEMSSTKDGAYSLKMESVIKGKATTILNYETSLPMEGKNDSLKLNVYDDQGMELSTSEVNQERASFNSPIDDDTKYLMIYPEFAKYEFDTIKPIDITPFNVKSKRFGYEMNVLKVTHSKKQVIVDYTIKNINETNLRKDIIKNFADSITLIKSKDVKEGLEGQALYETLKNDSIINGNQAKLINEKELHYQSIFNIEKVKNFDEKDYSLMVPFGVLSMNSSHVKLNPIMIKLKNEQFKKTESLR